MDGDKELCREIIRAAAAEAILLDTQEVVSVIISKAVKALVADEANQLHCRQIIMDRWVMWIRERKSEFYNAGIFDSMSHCFTTPQHRGQQLLNFLDEEKF